MVIAAISIIRVHILHIILKLQYFTAPQRVYIVHHLFCICHKCRGFLNNNYHYIITSFYPYTFRTVEFHKHYTRSIPLLTVKSEKEQKRSQVYWPSTYRSIDCTSSAVFSYTYVNYAVRLNREHLFLQERVERVKAKEHCPILPGVFSERNAVRIDFHFISIFLPRNAHPRADLSC